MGRSASALDRRRSSNADNEGAAGYVQESVSGLALTDLGVWRLDRERAKELT